MRFHSDKQTSIKTKICNLNYRENDQGTLSCLIENNSHVVYVMKEEMLFLTIEKVMAMTGWSKTTVQNLFNNPDFPSTNFGKSKLVTLPALVDYFSEPRRKEKFSFDRDRAA